MVTKGKANGFTVFCTARREQNRAEEVQSNISEFAKEWAELDPADRLSWAAEAKRRKDEPVQDMATRASSSLALEAAASEAAQSGAAASEAVAWVVA